MTTITSTHRSALTVRRSRPSLRPWWQWVLTAFAFPPAGWVGYEIVGRVDSVSAAVLGGLITGAGIGAAQWALLRHRGITIAWIAATAAGLGAGLAAGAALVSYRVDRPSLALMGAVCGLAIGLAQGTTMHDARRGLAWAGMTAALWAAGWTVTAAAGVAVDAQFIVFGISGALAVALVQSTTIGAFVPARTTAART